MLYPEPVLGVFDNITVQGNEIISTNTNGAINITPDGTGVLTLGGGSVVVSPALTANGNVTVGGTLGVTGATTLTSASLSTTLSVTGNSTLSNVTASGTLGVTGDATFGNATVNTSLTVNGILALTVNGVATLNDGTVINDILQVLDTQTTSLLNDSVAFYVGASPPGQHVEIDQQAIQSKSNTTTAGTLDVNGLGGLVRVGAVNGTSGINLRNLFTEVSANQSAALTAQNLGDAAPNLLSAQDIKLQLLRSDDELLGEIGFDNSTAMLLRSRQHGGGVNIEAEDSTGTLRTQVIVGTGAVELNFLGDQQFLTQDHTSGSAITGAQIHHRGAGVVDVGVGVYPEETVAASAFITPERSERWVRITGVATLTFDQNSSIPDGAVGMIANDSGATRTLAQGSGVTLTHWDGSGGATGSRFLADGGFAFWHKRNLTNYEIWGFGIT